MKKLFFVFVALLSYTATSFGRDSCLRRTTVLDNLTAACGTLEWRCAGDATVHTGSGSCSGDSIEFRVVYASVCGADRDQACGTAYNAWTTVNHNCGCKRKHQATVNLTCEQRDSADHQAYISGEECFSI